MRKFGERRKRKGKRWGEEVISEEMTGEDGIQDNTREETREENFVEVRNKMLQYNHECRNVHLRSD
jgi:hypothetical protein